MKSLSFRPTQAINFERLDEELRAELGPHFYGLSYHHGELTVHLAPHPDNALEPQIEALIQAHDPEALTEDQAQQAYLQALRQAQTPLPVGGTLEPEALLACLLEKVTWLEAEVRTLLKF
jgi:hypothetical protein